jgi:hypothetical protein
MRAAVFLTDLAATFRHENSVFRELRRGAIRFLAVPNDGALGTTRLE